MPTNVRVGPDVKLGTHDVLLFDGVESWGIRLEDGPRGIQELPTENVTERPHNLIQRDWEGGRGLKRMKDDPSRFADSKEAWTLTPGRIAPAPRWQIASGINPSDYRISTYNPSSYSPDGLGSGVSAYAWPWVASETYTITHMGLWIRKTKPYQSPTDVKYNLYNEHAAGDKPSSSPDSTGTLSQSLVSPIWAYYQVPVSPALAITAGSTYWAGVNIFPYLVPSGFTQSPEMGNDTSSTTGMQQSATYQDTWTALNGSGNLYFRVAHVDERRMHFFELDGALYMADQKDAGSTSQLWMNGDRGLAVGSSVASSVTLIDTSFGIQGSSWAADQWIGYRVKITGGPGQGQNRIITDSDSNTLTVSPKWDWQPIETSNYVIYGGPRWQELPSTGGNTAGSTVGANMDGEFVRDVTVGYKCARFAMGSGRAMIRMAYDSTNADHKWANDGSATADRLHSFQHPDDGWQTYSALTTSAIISRANSSVGYAASTFAEVGAAGDGDYSITALTDYDGKLFAMKEDSVWYNTGSTGLLHRLNVSLESMPNSNNGASPAASDMFLYFPWAFSMERYYGGTLDDIGPWKGEGLPSGRKGVVSAIEPAFGWLFVGIDAGSSGYSSVLLWNQRGYHEIFRGWKGARVRDLYFQGVEDGNPILWINCGGELVYVKFPRHSLNPLQESGFEVQPEAIIESAEIQYDDEGTPTFYKDITIHSENLNSSAWIEVGYQYNEDVGSTTWLSADAVYESPKASVPINVGQVYNFKYRLRLVTQDADQIPIVNAVEIHAFARRPVRYQWNMRARVSDLQRTYRGGRDHDPNKFITFLKDAASKAKRVFVRSKWPQFDDTWVVVDPPTVLRTYTTDIPKHQEGGVIPFSVREG